jgi:hypothetical protein
VSTPAQRRRNVPVEPRAAAHKPLFLNILPPTPLPSIFCPDQFISPHPKSLHPKILAPRYEKNDWGIYPAQNSKSFVIPMCIRSIPILPLSPTGYTRVWQHARFK